MLGEVPKTFLPEWWECTQEGICREETARKKGQLDPAQWFHLTTSCLARLPAPDFLRLKTITPSLKAARISRRLFYSWENIAYVAEEEVGKQAGKESMEASKQLGQVCRQAELDSPVLWPVLSSSSLEEADIAWQHSS